MNQQQPKSVECQVSSEHSASPADPRSSTLHPRSTGLDAAPRVHLSSYSAAGFDRGAGVMKEFAWLLISQLLFQWCPLKLSALKCFILRRFGAQVGRGVVIKPQVKITFPWKLTLGNHVWLGEECWLLNLAPINLGDDVCISQRAFLCTGNHDYSRATFDLMARPITIEQGAWVGAAAWVGPGVRICSHAVLAAGAVAAKDLEAFGIYQGNPAQWVKKRDVQ